MKIPLVLLLFIAVLPMLCFGQQYNPFPKTNGYWKQQYGDVLCLDINWTTDICCTFQYVLEGDTLIDTNGYKKLYRSGRYDTEWTFFDDGFIGGLRDDSINKKVYYYNASSNTEYLLYDFNLNTGDIFNQSYVYNCGWGGSVFDTIRIGTIDSILIGNQYVKRFQLLNAGWGGEISLIEGIGSTMGLLAPVYGYFEQHNDLICFKNNDTIEYGGQCDFISGIEEKEEKIKYTIYPNPTVDRVFIKSNDKITSVNIYDIVGRKIENRTLNKENSIVDVSGLEKGVYVFVINNNVLRKVVVE